MYLIMFQIPKSIHLNGDLILSLLSLLFPWANFHQHITDFFLSLCPSYKALFKIIAILQITPFIQLLLKPFINSLVVFTRTLSSNFSHFQKTDYLFNSYIQLTWKSYPLWLGLTYSKCRGVGGVRIITVIPTNVNITFLHIHPLTLSLHSLKPNAYSSVHITNHQIFMSSSEFSITSTNMCLYLRILYGDNDI